MGPFDFAFLDSTVEDRVMELEMLVGRGLLAPGALVAIHDANRGDIRLPEVADFWRDFDRARARLNLDEWIHLRHGRGMTILVCR